MLKSILAFLFPQAVALTTSINSPLLPSQQAAAMTYAGAMPDLGTMASAFTAIAANAAPNSGSVNYQTSAGATITLTNLAGLNLFLTNGGAVTVTLDNAPNVVAAIPGPYNGMTFPVTIAGNASTTVAAPTVTNTGITLAGTTTIVANGMRYYKGQITQLNTVAVNPLTSGTTFTSIAQIGSSNLYTLTLVTNAITTVVGNLIYLGVTAGTLPAGWYPCYTAGTTTIVIALPTSGTAWTATAATMTQPAAPTTPVYAPLITLTGLYFVPATIVA